MVVGLEWSSPYRLKPTMMSDQAWMDLAALGGTMQKQGWRQGRVRFKSMRTKLGREKRGRKSMKRKGTGFRFAELRTREWGSLQSVHLILN